MRALVYDGATARILDRRTPALAPQMALVRMIRAGVCNTDLEIVRGYMGFRGALGHELFEGESQSRPGSMEIKHARRALTPPSCAKKISFPAGSELSRCRAWRSSDRSRRGRSRARALRRRA